MRTTTEPCTHAGAPSPDRTTPHDAALATALDSAVASLPVILGSTMIVYAQVAPGALGAGFFLAFLGVAWVTLLTARSHRPVAYATRLFEAATLATLVQQLAARLPLYELPNTEAVRLGLLCTLSALAGLVVGLLWLLRAERLARFIPAPVYSGFASSIAISIVLSQYSSLGAQLRQPQLGWQVAATVLAVVATALLVQRLRPQWPASTLGLAAGIAVGWLCSQGPQELPRLMQAQLWLAPVQLADFSALSSPNVQHWPWYFDILKSAAILGTLVFLNNVVTGEQLAQLDDRRALAPRDKGLQAFAIASAGALGAPSISGSLTISLMAARSRPLTAPVMLLLALLLLALYASAVLTLIPVAALSGLLLLEAWQLWDRPSARHALRLLRRQALARHHKEDLLLIACVMLAALLVNIVTALLVGLVLGLVLHAHRHTQKPVRRSLTGLEIQSNCARTPAEFAALAAQGQAIVVLQLDSHQFFASTALLQDAVRQSFAQARCVILDWSAVRHIDSSLAQGIGRLQAQAHKLGIALLHAGALNHNSQVRALLADCVPPASMAADLDRALEMAENLLLQAHLPPFAAQDPQGHLLWPAQLSAQESAALTSALSAHQFAPGEYLLRAGEPSDGLWLVTQGQASVQIMTSHGTPLRISGVRAGTAVGHIGFIDRRVRSASVLAETPVQALRLSHEAFVQLYTQHPGLVQKIWAQLSIDLASHLRAANLHTLAQAHHAMA